MASDKELYSCSFGIRLICSFVSLILIIHCCFGKFSPSGVSELSRNISSILSILVNKSYYDKRLRPNYGGPTVDVGITMHVSSISAVSEVEMDYTLDFYLRQNWVDPRLDIIRLGSKNELTVSWEYTKDIWLPDTFFPNEKKSYFHTATTHNSFLRIKGRGEVLTSQRLTVTAACPMTLQLFPMDSQECTLEIESYGYSDADTKYRWLENKTVTMDDVKLPQFYVANFAMRNRTITLSTGDYSRLNVKFVFARNIGFYMMQIYIPSMLIVIISWVSFWIHRDASPARVSLGVTTVLTMTTLMTTTNASLPKVSYVKAIDIYLGTCFMMVFSSLIEYAMVSYLNKQMKMKREMRKQQQSAVHQPQQPLSSAGNDPKYGARLATTTEGRSPFLARNQTPIFVPQYQPPSYAPTFTATNIRPAVYGQPICACDINNQVRQTPWKSVTKKTNGYSDADIRLFWHKGFNSVTFDQEIRTLPTFELKNLYIVERVITLSTGDYSRLSLHLTFTRNLGYYWVQIYQPSIMVVIISWVSFWINRDSAPARVTLGIMTVLTMTTLMTSTNSQLPKVSYAKAVDVYLGFSFVIVFCALIEYALVSITVKRQNDKQKQISLTNVRQETDQAPKSMLTPLNRLPPPMLQNDAPIASPWKPCSMPDKINEDDTDELPCNCGLISRSMNVPAPVAARSRVAQKSSTFTSSVVLPDYPRFRRRSIRSVNNLGTRRLRLNCNCSPSNIDKYSRIIFPAVFIMFNMFYWTILLRKTSNS